MIRTFSKYCLIILLLISCTRSDNLESQWEQATSKNTIDAYNNFLSKYPDGKVAERARKKLQILYIEQYIRQGDYEKAASLIKDYYGEPDSGQQKLEAYLKILSEIKDARAVESLITVLTDSMSKQEDLPTKEAEILPNSVDHILEELKKANIAFNAPETMKVNETVPIILLMSKALSGKDLSLKLSNLISDSSKIGKTYWDIVKVSTKMEAHLSGLGFIVKPITPVAQLVREEKDTRWEWSVLAEEAGLRTLYLTLNAYVEYRDEKTTQTIQTYRKSVFVYVKPIDAIWAWINKNISWLTGLIGVIIGVVFAHWLTLMRENKKQEEAKQLEQEKKTKIILPNN